jgi:hypothetical protein
MNGFSFSLISFAFIFDNTSWDFQAGSSIDIPAFVSVPEVLFGIALQRRDFVV